MIKLHTKKLKLKLKKKNHIYKLLYTVGLCTERLCDALVSVGGGGAAGPEFSHTLVIVLKRRKTQEAKARGGDGGEGGMGGGVRYSSCRAQQQGARNVWAKWSRRRRRRRNT